MKNGPNQCIESDGNAQTVNVVPTRYTYVILFFSITRITILNDHNYTTIHSIMSYILFEILGCKAPHPETRHLARQPGRKFFLGGKNGRKKRKFLRSYS